MKILILGAVAAAGLLTCGISLAQTTQGTAPAGTAPTTAVPMSPSGSTLSQGHNAGAASGNNNQAVATTQSNAPMPAKGANSFTMREAKRRIEKEGFSNVTDLVKDNNGVWRGQAQKDGSAAPVWLDYKGNIGTGQ